MPMLNPVHAGVILREYMGESVTVSALAAHVGVSRGNLSMILNGRLGISAAVAVRLGDAFPQSDAEFWLALQAQYDLALVRKAKRPKIAPVLREAA